MDTIRMWQLQSADNHTICTEMAVPTVTSAWYRLAECIHVILTASGILFTALTLKYLRNKLYFHVNLNILIYFMIISANVLSLQMLIMQTGHLWRSFTFVDDCDVFVSARHCFPHLITNAMAIACITGAQVCMCLERLISTMLLRKYQKFGPGLAIALILTTLILFGVLIYTSYWDDPLDEAFLMCISIPARTSDKSNRNFQMLLGCNVFSIVSLIGIYFANRYYRTRLRFALADRYQAEENLATSSLIFIVVVAQFVICTLYGAATLILRSQRGFFNETTHRTAILFVYVVPYFTCVLPLLLTWIVRRGVELRGKNIATMVGQASRGEAGRDSYFDGLLKQWS